jgi:hypothetical protein
MGIIDRVLSKDMGATVHSFFTKRCKNKREKEKGHENYKIWSCVMSDIYVGIGPEILQLLNILHCKFR